MRHINNDRCMTYLSVLHVLILCIHCSVAVCSRACLNGGTLDAESCMCDCSGGFGGPNCESECIEKELSRLQYYVICTRLIDYIICCSVNALRLIVM